MPVQELQFTRFYPSEANEQDWDILLNLLQVESKESNPDDPPPPEALHRKQIEAFDDNPFFIPEIYLLRQANDTPVGRLIIAYPRPDTPEYENQKHMGMMMPFILPEYRRQGFGKFLLEKTVKDFDERGITLIQGDTTYDSGRAFAENFGATVAIESRVNRLYMNDVDWQLIESWVTESSQANPDVTIEIFEGLPGEADIEAFARLYTEVMNQQPFEELEGVEMGITPEKLRKIHEQAQDRGDIRVTRITRESDGTISGLTEIVYNSQRPHLARQDLTGVQSQYRGRGLGKWLKADMLLYIRETYPDVEYINTGNANSNAPMLSINERMGFKLYKHSAFYKLQIEEAMKHLGLS